MVANVTVSHMSVFALVLVIWELCATGLIFCIHTSVANLLNRCSSLNVGSENIRLENKKEPVQ